MQTFVSKGKNVKEAIQLGLDVMNVTMEDVNIEIIQSETKGFMGIGAKNAVVKLSKEEGTAEEEEAATDIPFEWDEEVIQKEIDSLASASPSQTDTAVSVADTVEKQLDQEDLKGKVWVKKGKLHVKDSPNRYPTVTIDKGIEVYRNNELVKESTVIFSEKDKMEIQIKKHEEQKTKWNVSMDSAKLHVVMEVIPGVKITRTIQDVEPAQHIKLIAEEHTEFINDIEYGHVMERLETLGVTYGFNQSEIEKALETTEKSTYEIATGKPADKGENGWLDLKVEIDAQNGLKEEGGKIDFREIKTIPVVDRGQVIAVINSPIPGTSGLTVTNETIPPAQTHPIILKAAKGVMLVEDKAVAMESGRPLIEQRGQFAKASILPKFLQKGNVNLSSGNIRFSGDVEIEGEVEENMLVEAGGDIMVHRSVSMATINASNAISVKRNVVGSDLSAGKNSMLIAELGHLLGLMHQQLEEMIAVINQLTKAAAFKSSDFNRGGLQPLIYILLEKRFKEFRSMAKKYVDVVKRGEQYLDEDWQQAGVTIRQIFLSTNNQLTSLEKLHHLLEKMHTLHELSKTPVEPDSYITISSALDSNLYCSGDITVIGQGCINTKVHSGGKFRVTGVLRGGEVYGRLGVEVEEAGAESGTPTFVSVPGDQTIKIKEAMEGTIIKIGSRKYTFNETRNNINAKLNRDGEIVFDS